MDYIKELRSALDAIVNGLREEVSGFRTNRPTTKLVENVKVDYMGTPMEMRQLGSISVELPRDIIVSPWDPATMPMIESAIREMKSGLSVATHGNLVRIKLPDMTEDRKKELAKVVKTSAENAKIRIRMIRDDFNKRIKDIPDEDLRFRTKENIQKEVDKANEQIEAILTSKIREIEE